MDTMKLRIIMSGGTVEIEDKKIKIITKIFKEKVNIYNLELDKIIITKNKFNKILGGNLNIECIKDKRISRYQFVYQKRNYEDVKKFINLIEQSNLPKGIIARAQGKYGILDLLENRIVIRRPNKFLSIHGNVGDKEILLSSITAVQLWEHNVTSDGYIQFSILGGVESAKKGIMDIFKDSHMDAFYDENTIIFNAKEAEDFKKIKELILNKIENRDNKSFESCNIKEKNNINDIEYLQKLAELRDNNIITKEEFELKKKEILGL